MAGSDLWPKLVIPVLRLQRLDGYLLPVVLLAIVVVIADRLWYAFLGPLSRFPGPRLVSVSGLWEMYQDLVRDGQGPHRIQELHEASKSPVVRIPYNFLYISDPAMFDEYLGNLPGSSIGNKFLKDPGIHKQLGNSGSIVTETDPDIHRRNRSLPNPHFRPKAVDDHRRVILAKL
ncbi:hypothetical protein F4778DRAFT_782766 [Xylariomycetidae sp. FL2044]|nr:hypothetical protein F4778DRAFT_782766 [Xylariomycetidae sp. FL2044]